MSGTWNDLHRELSVEKRRARAEHRIFDVADAMQAVSHWINVPLPRPAPDALVTAVGMVEDGPICSCTGGTCVH